MFRNVPKQRVHFLRRMRGNPLDFRLPCVLSVPETFTENPKRTAGTARESGEKGQPMRRITRTRSLATGVLTVAALAFLASSATAPAATDGAGAVSVSTAHKCLV